MTAKDVPFRPIGFWVKLVDRLLEERLTAELGQHGLSRRDWQVMNLVADGAAVRDDVMRELGSFDDGEESHVASVIERLVERGWVREGDGQLELTAQGDEVMALAQSGVARFRRSVSTDVDAEDYRMALDVLAKMAANLGWSS